eukprot:TRINITY_DN1496_c0_g1_i1.p1 TRINITY_DN1496_c0_g1~~TRINITY_DN1496_c0_g1_i1.p1  ORF type:complete len:649 (+),score=85.22 TRINITY_DN1496_c0_g1_i1:86-2032(+)
MMLKCTSTGLLLALFYSSCNYMASGVCADYDESENWRFLENPCKDQDYQRNAHFIRYAHESLSLPALAAMGSRAREILVLGGDDGGVISQVLKSSDVVTVTAVTHMTGMLTLVDRHFPYASGILQDKRLTIIPQDPLLWMEHAKTATEGSGFDLIIADFKWDARWNEDGPHPLKDSHFKSLADVLRPGGLVVYDAAHLWRSQFLRDAFSRMRAFFPEIWTLQHSAPDGPDRLGWHKIAFVAGDLGSDVLKMDSAWWAGQGLETILYNEGMHKALLTPSATLSKVLGLQIPRKPDLVAASKLNVSMQPLGEIANPFVCWNESVKEKLLHSKKSKYQSVKVSSKKTCNILYLDGESQLTSEFGDFYHEALVHPAMAALGHRGKRVLIIGAGDGGVGSVVLRYPNVEQVVQIEIDEEVVAAAKAYFPEYASSYSDPRLHLLITDAVKLVQSEELGARFGTFDLCIIDSTDSPIDSPWSVKFFKALRKLLAPHGAIIQNIHAQDQVGDFLEVHDKVFSNLKTINCNNPDYASPYMLAVLTDSLDLDVVDWEWWSSLNIPTIYYHPTLHQALLAVPEETQDVYIKGEDWEPHDLDFIEEFYEGKKNQDNQIFQRLSNGKKDKAATDDDNTTANSKVQPASLEVEATKNQKDDL